MAYPNLSSGGDSSSAFTVELTEKNQRMDQGSGVGFEGLDDKEAPQNGGEQRKLISSDVDISRPRLTSTLRVCYLYVCVV